MKHYKKLLFISLQLCLLQASDNQNVYLEDFDTEIFNRFFENKIFNWTFKLNILYMSDNLMQDNKKLIDIGYWESHSLQIYLPKA